MKRKQKAIDELERMYGQQEPTPAAGRSGPRSRQRSCDAADRNVPQSPPPPSAVDAATSADARMYDRLPPAGEAARRGDGAFDIHGFVDSLVKHNARAAVGRKLQRKTLRLAALVQKRHSKGTPTTRVLPRRREKERLALSLSKAKFAEFAPLQQLWLQYMEETWAPPPLDGTAATMSTGLAIVDPLEVDLRGAVIAVVQARCSSLVGLRGIVLQETTGTLQIVTTDNKFKTIPKNAGCVVSFEFAGRTVKIPLRGGDDRRPAT